MASNLAGKQMITRSFTVSNEMRGFFLLVSIILFVVTIPSAYLATVAGKSYVGKSPEIDYNKKLLLDPRSGTQLPEAIRDRVGLERAIVVLVGECTPCTLARFEKLSIADWKLSRIFLFARTKSSLQILISSPLLQRAAGFELYDERVEKDLNAFFTPRAFRVYNGKLETEAQSPFQVMHQYIRDGQ